jgi:hypothetical protein
MAQRWLKDVSPYQQRVSVPHQPLPQLRAQLRVLLHVPPVGPKLLLGLCVLTSQKLNR